MHTKTETALQESNKHLQALFHCNSCTEYIQCTLIGKLRNSFKEMRRFDWDSDKNLRLQAERNVSFEDVVTAIASGYLLDIEPGRASYPHQQVYIVALEGYAYMVPHVVEDDICFLKTIIPSRVHTKHFFTE